MGASSDRYTWYIDAQRLALSLEPSQQPARPFCFEIRDRDFGMVHAPPMLPLNLSRELCPTLRSAQAGDPPLSKSSNPLGGGLKSCHDGRLLHSSPC